MNLPQSIAEILGKTCYAPTGFIKVMGGRVVETKSGYDDTKHVLFGKNCPWKAYYPSNHKGAKLTGLPYGE